MEDKKKEFFDKFGKDIEESIEADVAEWVAPSLGFNSEELWEWIEENFVSKKQLGVKLKKAREEGYESCASDVRDSIVGEYR